jgi:integrase/recombinase XerD
VEQERDDEGNHRDVALIVPPLRGEVIGPLDEVPPYRLSGLGSTFETAANSWLRALFAADRAALTIRSYAYDLLRWGRFLLAPTVDLNWNRVTEDDYADFVLWARQAEKLRTANKGKRSEKPAVNALTGKPYVGDTLAGTTINHSDSVVRKFYDYWTRRPEGPVRNPVPASDPRPNAHHNPLEPFTRGRRRGFRQREVERLPRALTDDAYDTLFATLPHDRDRALLESYVSTGARASEMLGVEGQHVDYGAQQFLVVRKGTQAQQWLQASSDAFAWLAKYLAQEGAPRPGEPLWRTLRGPSRPLTYHAWYQVFDRANERLGTNWTSHDLRHTCALRLMEDENLSLRDVQEILGHAHITTTERYLRVRPEEVIQKVREHQRRRKEAPAPQPPTAGMGYSPDDFTTVFGGLP